MLISTRTKTKEQQYQLHEHQMETNPAYRKLLALFTDLFQKLDEYDSNLALMPASSAPLDFRGTMQYHEWANNVANAEFHAETTFLHANTFYTKYSELYLDQGRSIFGRILRWIIGQFTTNPFRSSVATIVATTLLSGSGAYLFGSAHIDDETKLKQLQEAEASSRKLAELSKRGVDISENMVEAARTTLTGQENKEQDAADRLRRLEVNLDNFLKGNAYGEYKEDIANTETLIQRARIALDSPLSSVLKTTTMASQLVNLDRRALQASQESAANINALAAQNAAQNLHRSTIITQVWGLLSNPYFWIGTSVVGLGIVGGLSMSRRKSQRKLFNRLLASAVTESNLIQTKDKRQRIANADNTDANTRALSSLAEFQQKMEASLFRTGNIQLHILMLAAKAHKDRHYPIDFLPYYYFLRQFMRSTFNLSEEDCENDTYLYFFEEVFGKVDSDAGRAKYHETGGQCVGDYIASTPVLSEEDKQVQEDREVLSTTEVQTEHKQQPRNAKRGREIAQIAESLRTNATIFSAPFPPPKERTKKPKTTPGPVEKRKVLYVQAPSNFGEEDVVVTKKARNLINESPERVQFEEDLHQAREADREVEFWRDRLTKGDKLARIMQGRNLWKHQWVYLHNSQEFNKDRQTECDRSAFRTLVSKLDVDSKICAELVCRGHQESVVRALLPEAKDELRSDRSKFYYQSYVDQRLLKLVNMYIDHLLMDKLSNADPNSWSAAFEARINQFIEDSQNLLRNNTVESALIIVYALRALTPAELERQQVDNILSLKMPAIKLKLVEFNMTLLSLYTGKPVNVEPSTNVPIVHFHTHFESSQAQQETKTLDPQPYFSESGAQSAFQQRSAISAPRTKNDTLSVVGKQITTCPNEKNECVKLGPQTRSIDRSWNATVTTNKESAFADISEAETLSFFSTPLDMNADAARTFFVQLLDDTAWKSQDVQGPQAYKNQSQWIWMYRWMGLQCSKWIDQPNNNSGDPMVAFGTTACQRRFVFLVAMLHGAFLYPFATSKHRLEILEGKNLCFQPSPNHVIMSLDDCCPGKVMFYGWDKDLQIFQISVVAEDLMKSVKTTVGQKPLIDITLLQFDVGQFVQHELKLHLKKNLRHINLVKPVFNSSLCQKYRSIKSTGRVNILLPQMRAVLRNDRYDFVVTPLLSMVEEGTDITFFSRAVGESISKLLAVKLRNVARHLPAYYPVSDYRSALGIDRVEAIIDKYDQVYRQAEEMPSMNASEKKSSQAVLSFPNDIQNFHYRADALFLEGWRQLDLLEDDLAELRRIAEMAAQTMKANCQHVVLNELVVDPVVLTILANPCVVVYGDRWFLNTMISDLTQNEPNIAFYVEQPTEIVDFLSSKLTDKFALFRDTMYTQLWANLESPMYKKVT
jgi:hypothetical protein